MAMSVNERQKKWQDRQKNNGKKRVTVIIEPDAWSALASEKARTGESFSRIVSRALVGTGGQIVSDNESSVSAPGAAESVSDNHADVPSEAVERIVTLMGVVGLSPAEVAGRLNDERIAPAIPGEDWDADAVMDLYRRATTSEAV